MNPFGDGWKQNIAVGVAERDTGDTNEEPATFISLDDDEDDNTESPADQSGRRAASRRKRIAGAVCFLLILIVAGAGLWMMVGGGGKTKINVPVRDNAQRTDQVARENADETAQAIAEVPQRYSFTDANRERVSCDRGARSDRWNENDHYADHASHGTH